MEMPLVSSSTTPAQWKRLERCEGNTKYCTTFVSWHQLRHSVHMGRAGMTQNAPPLNSCKNSQESENKREKINVIVRLRPEKEGHKAATQKVAFCNGTNGIILVPPEHSYLQLDGKENESRKRKAPTTHIFTFDGVLSEMTPQGVVYEKCVAPLVQSACKGWNTTVLAYGATSSGKSYTMQGVPGDEGITPRALEDVFTYIDNSLKDGNTETIFSAHISFVELYNGKFRQLLEDEDQIASKTFCCSKQENRESSKVEVRETKGGKVYLVGGSSLKRLVINLEEAKMLVCTGNHRRATRATDCNAHSSCSHAILTIYIERSSNSSKVKVGKIHLVDLAGSERASMSGAIGDQMLELQHNNLALSNLGLVLQYLSCDEANGLGQSKVCPPYRSNKLTHFLKDSIGGNSKTLIISTLRTISEFYQLSLSTLLCSSRARHIQDKTRLNFDSKCTSHLAGVRSEMMGIKHRLHDSTFDLNQALDLYLALHRDGTEDSQELKKKIRSLSISTDLEHSLLENKLATVIFALQHTGITRQRKQLDSLSRTLHGVLEESEEKSARQCMEILQLRQSLQEIKEGMSASLSETDTAQNMKQQVLHARTPQMDGNHNQAALETVMFTLLEDQKTQLEATEDKEKGMVSAWLRVSEVAGITTVQGPVPVDYLCARISDLVAKGSLCDQYQKQISVLRRSCFTTSAALVGAQRLIAQYDSNNTERNNPLLPLEFGNQDHSSCHIFDLYNNEDSTTTIVQPIRQLGLDEGLTRLLLDDCEPLRLKLPSHENNTFQPTFEEDHNLAKHTNGDCESNTRFGLKWQQVEKAELEFSLNQAWKKPSLLDNSREQEQSHLPLCYITRERCGREGGIGDEAEDKSELQVISTDPATLYESQRNVVPECGVVDASSEGVLAAAAHHSAKRDPVEEMQREELHLLQYEYQCRESELKSALKESRALVDQIRVSYARSESIRRAEIRVTLEGQEREKQIILDRCNELKMSMKTINDLLVEAYKKISVVENSENEVCTQLSFQNTVVEELQVEVERYKALHSNAQQELVNMSNEKQMSLDEHVELKSLVLSLKASLIESQKRVSDLEASNKAAHDMAAAEVESWRDEFQLKFDVAQSEWQAALNAKELHVSELQQDRTIALNKCNTLSTSVMGLESSLHESREQLLNLKTACVEAQCVAEVELEALRTDLELKLKMAESVNETHEAKWRHELKRSQHKRAIALKQRNEARDSLRVLESSLHESQHMAAAEIESWRDELQLKFDVAQSEWQAALNAKELHVSELQQDRTIALNKCNTLSASVMGLESSLHESREQLLNLKTACVEAQCVAEVELEALRTDLELKLKMAESVNETHEAKWRHELKRSQHKRAIALKQRNEARDSLRVLESSLHESQHMAATEIESWRGELQLKLMTAENEFHVALKREKIHKSEIEQGFEVMHNEKSMALAKCNELSLLVTNLKVSLLNIEQAHAEEQSMAAADFESLRNELQWKAMNTQNELGIVQNATKSCRTGQEQFILKGDISNHAAHKVNDTDLSLADNREFRLQTPINMALQRNRNNSPKNVKSSDLQTIVEMSLKNSLAIERRRIADLEISCKWTNDSHVLVKVYCPIAREKYGGELELTQDLLNLTRRELEKERANYSAMLKKAEDLYGSVKASFERPVCQAQKMLSEQKELCTEAAQLCGRECHFAIVHLKRRTYMDKMKRKHSDIELSPTTDQYRAGSVAQQPQVGRVPLEEVENDAKSVLRGENDVTLCCGSKLVYLVKGLHTFLNDACIQLGQQNSANERRFPLYQQHVDEIQTVNYLQSELSLPRHVIGTSITEEFQKQQDEEQRNMVAFNQCCCNNLRALEDINLETWLESAHEKFSNLLRMVDNKVTQARTLRISLEEAWNTSTQAQAGRIKSENALATAMFDLKKVTAEHTAVLGQIDELHISVGALKEKLTAAHSKCLELDALREEAQFTTAGTESALYELEERLRLAQTSNAVIVKENGQLMCSFNRARSDLVKLQNICEEKYSTASELELMKNTLEEQFCAYKIESKNIKQCLIRERMEALDRCNSLSVSVSRLKNLLNVKFQEISELKLSHKNNFLFPTAFQDPLSAKSKLKRLEGQITATQKGHPATPSSISTPHDDSQLRCYFYGNTLSCTDPVARTTRFFDDKKINEAEILQQTQTQMLKGKEKLDETLCCKDADFSHVSEMTMHNHDEPRSHHSWVEEAKSNFPWNFCTPSKSDALRHSEGFIKSEVFIASNKQHQQSNDALAVNRNEHLIQMGNLKSSISVNGDELPFSYAHIKRDISRTAAATSSQMKGLYQNLKCTSIMDGTQLNTVPLCAIYEEQQRKLKMDVAQGLDKPGEKAETDGSQTLYHESFQLEEVAMSNQPVKLRKLLSTHPSDVVAEERKWFTSRKRNLEGTGRATCGGMKGNCQPVIPQSTRKPLQHKNHNNSNIRRSSSANLKAYSYDNDSGVVVVKKEKENEESCLKMNNHEFLTRDNERGGPNKSRTLKYKCTEVIDGLISRLPKDQHGLLLPPCGDGRNSPHSTVTSTLGQQHLKANKPSELSTVRRLSNELFAIGQLHCASSRDRKVLRNIQPLVAKVKGINGGGGVPKVNTSSVLLHQLKHKPMNRVSKKKKKGPNPDKENIGPGVVLLYR